MALDLALSGDAEYETVDKSFEDTATDLPQNGDPTNSMTTASKSVRACVGFVEDYDHFVFLWLGDTARLYHTGRVQTAA